MARRGASRARVSFADASAKLDRQNEVYDPPASEPRLVETGRNKSVQVVAGQWPGAPFDALPPGCPVMPLGTEGKVAYFVDSLGQIIPVLSSEWGKKILQSLFALTPHYLEWAWPKRSKDGDIVGVHVDHAVSCLVKGAAQRGLFQPHERVRGRGAWTDNHDRLIWHAGNRLFMVDGGVLKENPLTEIDGKFYPARPKTIEPWPEPVNAEDSPAQEIFKSLRTWSWGRPDLDPLIVLGGIGCMLIGGALSWRPHLFISGDSAVGKTELQRVIKAVLTSALQDTANSTEAGVRQRVGLDTLPVAVDEMEASADNRRVMAIIELIRLSSSGSVLWRGGQDHRGVEFQARCAFLATGIIPPPMKPQDRNRFARLDLNRLNEVGEPPVIDPDAGRMILRAIMDAWGQFAHTLADWKHNLREAGLNGRQRDTWAPLFAMAEILLGPETMEDAGMPVTEPGRIGQIVADATKGERAEHIENWRECLEYLLGSTIDAWKSGEKPTVGAALADLDDQDAARELKYVRNRLAAAGLGVVEEKIEGSDMGERQYLLAVPRTSPLLDKLFAASQWSQGGWWASLRQGQAEGPVCEGYRTVKINRVAMHCVLVDLAKYDDMAGL